MENQETNNTKFCKFCGGKIPMDAILCTLCGRQVEELKTQDNPQIIINNSNSNVNKNASLKQKNKWVALLLCLFLGFFGAHKFYEGKILFGIIYFLTFGLFGIGIIIDAIAILLKPNPYCV